MPLTTSDAIEEPHLNLTPMIDIVFLLVIFFMVGAQFTERERQFDIQVPTVSDSQPLTSLPDELIINIREDGTIVLGTEKRTLGELETELKAAKANFDDQAVVIRGAKAGPYQHVMDVLAVCNRVQIKSISLANRVKKEDEP